jgi:hypothetical protein
MTLRHLTLLVMLAGAAACGRSGPSISDEGTTLIHAGVNTGNGLASASFAFGAAQAPDPNNASTTVTVPDRSGTPFTLTTARAAIGRVTLESSTAEVRLPGPFVADLLAQTLTPSLQDVAVPAAAYTAVTLTFAQAKAGLSPSDPLDGNTIYLAGTFVDAGTPTRFSVALQFNEDARFASAGTIDLARDTHALLRVEFDIAGWFSTLPLTDCLTQGDLGVVNGVLNLGQSHGGACSDVRGALKDAIEASGTAHKD